MQDSDLSYCVLTGGCRTPPTPAKDTDRHAWAAHYLTAMRKAVVDDAVKVLTRGRASTVTPQRTAAASEE
ncbi:DUF3077 domain-containing protein [Pseudomonas sp. MPC6]|nr:DUF3077 domain-containing protein [Pseudomonas sp. MPC6]